MILYYLVIALHFIVCVALIVIVLLQAGKGGGMAGIFGGGGSDQIFSAPSGMAFIKKVTVVCAVIFMLTSLALTLMSTRVSMQSVIDQISNIPVASSQQPLE
ncbi:preprotein translocase subunit SecG [Candidatus Ruminimicrobium bovinum]|uniref:preprotein translocase subunit SecG n=1 Tax=Candidatus Ruminimicrobium bovinum TaxID=3242779 RepID=UPI0039B969D0